MSGQPTPRNTRLKLEAAFQLLVDAFKEKNEQENDGTITRWTVSEVWEDMRIEIDVKPEPPY